MSATYTEILLTAVLSSLITLLLLWLIYMLVLRGRLIQRRGELADMVQERVRQGAIEAGEELLPKFRDSVTEGFTRAIREWPSNEFRNVTRSGINLVEEGLATILGGRDKPGDSDK